MKLGLTGKYKIEQFRDGKLIATREGKNVITTEGAAYILNTAFDGGTPITTWYCGLLKGGFTPIYSYDLSDLVAHEFTTYDEAARPEWDANTSSGRTIYNGTKISFTISTGVSDSVGGIFISNITTKLASSGGTSWCGTQFSAALTPVAGDIVKVQYTVEVNE